MIKCTINNCQSECPRCQEFCVDVSAYQPVQWVELEDEECDTVFVKRCGERKENVCADVVETRCEVIPYTECSMGMVPQPLNRTKLAPKLFVEKTCEQVCLSTKILLYWL